MRVWGCLPLILFLILLALLPLVFGQLFATALMKLRLEPSTAILLVMGIILGGGINSPQAHCQERHTHRRSSGNPGFDRPVAMVSACPARNGHRRQRGWLPDSCRPGHL
jgi:hypothetical protein